MARNIQSEMPIEFVNALRNTRIPPSLPAMAYSDAESQCISTKNQSRGNYWDWTNEFDFLLSSLMAQHASTAIQYRNEHRAGRQVSESDDPLQRIRDLWADAFPDRELAIEDYRPVIRSFSSGADVSYSAQTMSDGERTAIYLAGRVFRASPGVLVVDEPENHLHSHLASRLWDELEQAQPDLRFVYITHDLTFARTRKNATYIIASPIEGLKVVDVGDSLADDVADILLGAASASFHAKRIVFCEGGKSDRDAHLYGAWFNTRMTVIKPVGGSEMVHRCLSALSGGSLFANLQVLGIIDRDFQTDAYLKSLPNNLFALQFHEVESLYCLPQLVKVIASYTRRDFDEAAYVERVRQSITEQERQKVVLERWKRREGPKLIGVVAAVHGRNDSLDDILSTIPSVFSSGAWILILW
jgi:hypothetical protein